jgi:hypothetical protein
MTKLRFKGKEFVYTHHLAVAFRPAARDAGEGIEWHAVDSKEIILGDTRQVARESYSGKRSIELSLKLPLQATRCDGHKRVGYWCSQ